MILFPIKNSLLSLWSLQKRRFEPIKIKRQCKLNKNSGCFNEKGLFFSITNEILDQIKLEREDDDWYELIESQGNKLWSKYASKLTGIDLKMKTKQALYQKGFPIEVIDRFYQRRRLKKMTEKSYAEMTEQELREEIAKLKEKARKAEQLGIVNEYAVYERKATMAAAYLIDPKTIVKGKCIESMVHQVNSLK